MKIDNPLNWQHCIYQRRVNRFTITALVIMSLAAALGFGWLTLQELVAAFVVCIVGGAAGAVVMLIAVVLLKDFISWLSGR